MPIFNKLRVRLRIENIRYMYVYLSKVQCFWKARLLYVTDLLKVVIDSISADWRLKIKAGKGQHLQLLSKTFYGVSVSSS